MELEILYQDDYYVAINKPHNLLVHRTHISEEKEHFAVQMLKEQLKVWVTPCHRLDRKTSGILLFAFDKESAVALMNSFAHQKVSKEYKVLVRGFLPDSGFINKALVKENGNLQKAETCYQALERFELPFEVSRYPQSRYTLANIVPLTGRMHQIRRHMAHARHYVIGDKVYGECKHNRAFEVRYNLQTMLLHAHKLEFTHYRTSKKIKLEARMQPDFQMVLEALRKQNLYLNESFNSYA